MIHESANIYNSTIGEQTKVAAFVEIGGATIGKRCKVQAFAFVCPGVTIGDDVFIGPHVCFCNDRFPHSNGAWTLEKTVVRNGASIGAGAVILPGITIGEHAIVGAGAVVTANVDAGDIVAGNPARSIVPSTL